MFVLAAPLPGLGRSNSQEAGLYRRLLNELYQLGQITKPEFTSIEQKEGTRSLGFKGVVTFNIDGKSKKIEILEVESSKPLAQEKAAERAYRWIQGQGMLHDQLNSACMVGPNPINARLSMNDYHPLSVCAHQVGREALS